MPVLEKMRSWLTLLFPQKCANQSFSYLFQGMQDLPIKYVYHMDSHKEEKQTLESITIPGHFLTTSPSWH